MHEGKAEEVCMNGPEPIAQKNLVVIAEEADEDSQVRLTEE